MKRSPDESELPFLLVFDAMLIQCAVINVRVFSGQSF
jgi:hypothetical protein